MYTTFLLYYSSSRISKFIQGKSPLLQQLASVSLLKEKLKICPKLIELLCWNGPTVHVCFFMLARTSTKTFVSRVQKTAKKIFVSQKTRQQSHSLAEVSLYMRLTYMATCQEIGGGHDHICASKTPMLLALAHYLPCISVTTYLIRFKTVSMEVSFP